MSETLDAPKTETPAAEDAARWKVHVGAFYKRLIDGGMHIDNATQAAYWRLVFDYIDAGGAADEYEAEAGLRALGISPPKHPLQRWTRLRGRDFGSPGSGMDAPAGAVVEDNRTPPGWSVGDRISRMRDHERGAIMRLWQECHGRAVVPAAGIDQRVRDALAGSQIGNWSEQDFAAVMMRFENYRPTNDQTFTLPGRAQGRPADFFALDYPELPQRRRPTDPTFLRWHQFIEQRVRELREDGTFQPDMGYDLRIALADRQALEEAHDAYAAEHGIVRGHAQRDFARAGIHP